MARSFAHLPLGAMSSVSRCSVAQPMGERRAGVEGGCVVGCLLRCVSGGRLIASIQADRKETLFNILTEDYPPPRPSQRVSSVGSCGLSFTRRRVGLTAGCKRRWLEPAVTPTPSRSVLAVVMRSSASLPLPVLRRWPPTGKSERAFSWLLASVPRQRQVEMPRPEKISSSR